MQQDIVIVKQLPSDAMADSLLRDVFVPDLGGALAARWTSTFDMVSAEAGPISCRYRLPVTSRD